MFYLIYFTKVLKENMLSGFMFILTTVGMVFFFAHGPWIQAKLENYWGENEKGDYFFALIPVSENASWISRKLMTLPEIKAVNVVDRDVIDAEVKSILHHTGLLSLENILKVDYVALKVNFSKNVTTEQHLRVRDYLQRLSQEKNIMMGATKTSKKNHDSQSGFFLFVTQHSVKGLIGLMFFAWMISLWFLSSAATRWAYLVEQYQRKTKVRCKILMAGSLAIFICAFAMATLWGKPNFVLMMMPISLMLPVFLFGVLRYSWNS